MIEVRDLTKAFPVPKGPDVVAVDHITFTVPKGIIFGLIGDNGAGKTTTLRMLSTVIQPTGGSASVNGYDVQKDPESVRRSIGFLSGTTGLYGRLTPIEVLQYFGELYGMERTALKNRIDELVNDLSLGEFIDRKCEQLSTGQKQRVGIARVVLHNPSVLFLDEPTSGLDVQSSQAVMEFIEGARNAGKTVVYSSHIMSEVERLCDDVVILHEGKICGAGSPASLKSQTGEQSMEKAFLSLVGYRREEMSIS